MYVSRSKVKQKIFFTIAWLNAILAIVRFVPSCSTIVGTAEGLLERNIPRKYTLSSEEDKKLDEMLDAATEKKKVIVAWDWSTVSKTRRTQETLPKRCGSCTVIYDDNSKITDNQTGAVVFNYKTARLGNMPLRSLRRPDQLYVWQCGESPTSIKKGMLKDFRFEDLRKFNATMTLRRDSDVVFAYGSAADALRRAKKILQQDYGGSMENIAKSKTEMAVAVISNCKYLPGARLRVELIDKLEKHGLKITKYGSCFDNILEKGNSSFDVFKSLRNHKFYLAFENSFHCKDYITEKFFVNGLGHGLVPVVWGARREDYEAIAPPNSFIHVDDFKSVEELTDRLVYLSENDEAYLEYFRWYHLSERDMPNFRRTTSFCQLCRMIHGINVDDIYKPGFNPAKLDRPLFGSEVAKRKLGIMSDLIYGKEEDDCFKNTYKILQTSDTLMARG